MKGIQFAEFGPPSVLRYVDIATPILTASEMLLKVRAAGINPIDAKIREGSSFVARKLILPSGLGYDICGEIVECGSHIREFKVGDVVLGSIGRHEHPGAYAEYCKANISEVILKPQSLDVAVAAAIPIPGLTAWQAIHRYGKIKTGDHVLIQAAAGGVGHLAVQFAKAAGAYVIATASAKHHEFLSALGVDLIIDYTKQDFTEIVHDVDLVIDLVGGAVGIKSIQVLKPNGILVTVPTITKDQILEQARQRPIHAIGMLAEMDLNDLKQITQLVANNIVKIQIEQRFALKDAAKAHELLQQKHTQGKLILLP